MFLKAMKKTSAGNVIKFLIQEVFHTFGTPEVIHSDNGKQFVSAEFKKMIEDYRITHMRTAIYSPQSNASERVNQQVLSTIRAYLEKDRRDWDKFLSEIECALRSSVHIATGMSPYFVLFGQNMFTNGSDYKLARKLRASEEREMQIIRNDKLTCIREGKLCIKPMRSVQNAIILELGSYNLSQVKKFIKEIL